METLIIVLVVISFVVCFLMIGVILLQEDKTGGGIGIVGGSSQSFFGANSSSILVKITTVLFVIFMVLMLGSGLISSTFSKGSFVTEKDVTAPDRGVSFKKRLLKDAPIKIGVEDFENGIIAKITEEKDKNFINGVYKKDSSNKYFVLDPKISKTDKKKVVGFLNLIGFTLEAETTLLDKNPNPNDKGVGDK